MSTVFRYLKESEEKEMRIKEMKRKVNDKYKEQKQRNIREMRSMNHLRKQKEKEGKRIRLKILLDGEDTQKKRQTRIQR